MWNKLFFLETIYFCEERVACAMEWLKEFFNYWTGVFLCLLITTSPLGYCPAFQMQVLQSLFWSSVWRAEWVNEEQCSFYQEAWWMPVGFSCLLSSHWKPTWLLLKDIPIFSAEWLEHLSSCSFLFYIICLPVFWDPSTYLGPSDPWF